MDYPKSVPGVGLVEGRFVDENPATGQIGSLIPSAWSNALMAELLGVIKAAGIVPSEDDNGQLLSAIQTMAASDYKKSVRVATVGPIALSGLQSVDGIALVAGERVLVKNQADLAQNWIYVVAAGAWQRAQDANESAECSPGHLIAVQAGTQGAGTVWQLANTERPTVGVDALNFRLLFGKTGVVAGSYRKVDVDAFGRVVAGSNPTTLADSGIVDAYTQQQVNDLLPTGIDGARVSIASVANIDLNAVGPSTGHIRITGSNTINAFTVKSGKCYFTVFSGSLIITNSASVVTNTGANIAAQAGDSCIIRAVADNVVEIVCGNFAVNRSPGVGRSWQDLTATRVAGTAYPNNTGRDLMVVMQSLASAQTLQISVDGVTWVTFGQLGSSGDVEGLSVIVPAGHFYRSSGTGSLFAWLELR